MAKTLAYLGPEGTFSHQAALKCSKTGALPKPYPTIAHILSAVDKGEADFGVVPAENSIEGSVNITLDMLAHELSLYIQQEIVIDITHHLFSYTSSLAEIRTVMSHPQALAQCRRFLEKELAHAALVETSSTAEAVRLLSPGAEGTAAIASWDSHTRYGVPCLIRNIGDYPHNQTRFLLVGKEPCPSNNTCKTTLVLTLAEDRPGSLYEILGDFAKMNINLTRIESRPAKSQLGKYIFFIDCEAGSHHPGLQQVLENLPAKTALLKNLGSYTTSCPC
ncbi:MAG: prephenate dehydratase [Peptococcaceae bacterium]|jgi:prephenate dehydratase|nr:prephenate dehydratase [Peptococcaceae bacterium]MDH7523994.1 prephenate dehydratase [Peptococcaceae bacterium]